MSDELPPLVLALSPFTRGYAFVAFEGPNAPFDWAVKEIKEKHKNTRTLADIERLIERYCPDRIVIEGNGAGWLPRGSRIQKLFRLLTRSAEREGVKVYRCPKRYLMEYFGPVSKHELARIVAVQLPGLAHRLPPRRKAWTAEDPRQALFDAAALGLVYYGLVKGGEDL